MTKQVLDVGNCGPDHMAIRNLLTRHFDCQVTQAHDGKQALERLKQGDFALVLVNRKLDRDYTDGVEIIRQIKADPQLTHRRVMLITNFTEHQEAAVALGAERGFGKLEFEKEKTIELLRPFLSPDIS
jgi:two-component system, chemotaxis family, chemotaxis protein CheY